LWFSDWFKKRNLAAEPGDQLRILAVSIFLDDRFVLERIGNLRGWQLCFSRSPKDAFRLASQSDFDVILCDRNQPGYPWREVMDGLAASSPRSCIILISPKKDDHLWWDVLNHRGFDVLIRPLRDDHVLRMIDAAMLFLAPAVSCSRS
jgi:DNA-binding NtrC family response regulator